MIDDRELRLSRAQVITGATAYVSTDLWDAKAPINLGQGPRTPVAVIDIAAKGGTVPTLSAAVLVGADDAAFSVNKITVATFTPPAADPAVPLKLVARPVSHTPKRYYRFEYTTSGTDDSFTLTAGIVLDVTDLNNTVQLGR